MKRPRRADVLGSVTGLVIGIAAVWFARVHEGATYFRGSTTFLVIAIVLGGVIAAAAVIAARRRR